MSFVNFKDVDDRTRKMMRKHNERRYTKLAKHEREAPERLLFDPQYFPMTMHFARHRPSGEDWLIPLKAV